MSSPNPGATFREMDPSTLRERLARGEVVLVDVREPDEHAAERIEGARPVPLSRFELGALQDGSERALVFQCRSGRRSGEAAARAAGMGIREVWNLKGGIEAWKELGLPVARGARMPISVMRQTQIVIGALVLVGSVLAATVSVWFLLLPGLMGLGLLVAGITSVCGLATVLALAPWNRVFRTTSDAGTGSNPRDPR